MSERKKVNHRYSFNHVEEKWRNKEQNKEIKFKEGNGYKYILEMWPYPSGKCHMGHIRNYEIGEILRRYYYLNGIKVFRPMGWDAFGLPAENAAIENNTHPNTWTINNIQNMKKTLVKFGYWYDWDHEMTTCDVSYYKHQQKIFIEMYKKGIVIKKKEWINWDPVDLTVLANEQIDDKGKSWRSGAIAEKKQIEQWFFNISQYADQLLNDLDLIRDTWPEKVIKMQENWIGKSQGFIIYFPIGNDCLEVFTTTPEVVFGCSFIVISAESSKALEINEELTKKYLNTPQNERKTCLLGYCINPYTKKEIPIYIADYVLSSYGTGIVMGVPIYDERDDNFANINKLEKTILIDDDGLMINSDFLNGMTREEARLKISKELEKRTCYRLKDWCISRQRYWGCPIPMYYCPNCGMLPEERLPVILPTNIDINSKGNPLSFCEEWLYTDCAKCGAKSKRETDTMDTFVDSSWYMLRFPNAKDDRNILDKNVKEIDLYLGGIEHACLHLLYSRFFTKVLRDLGMITLTEPFKKLVCQGMVCHPIYQGVESKKYYYPSEVQEENGKFYSNTEEVSVGGCEKMSKSKKNIVDPEEMMDSFGTDTLRMFVISDSPIEKDFDWNTNALFGCHRFLQSVWRLTCNIHEKLDDSYEINTEFKNKIEFFLFEISRHIEKISLNLYIAQVRMFFNFLEESLNKVSKTELLYGFKHFLRCFWIVCPSLSYECYEVLFDKILSEHEMWEKGKALDKLDILTIVIQVNGIKKDVFQTGLQSEKDILEEAKNIINIDNYKKHIYIPGKIINFVL